MRSKVFILLLMLLLVPVASVMGAGKRFTLVIDAGHGGHDSGAKGAISYEKNLTLKYALALGAAVERQCPDVRVVYTRKTDVFLPLHERADIANRLKADLFISIHINALDGGHIGHGFQSYTLGTGERTGTRGLKENLEVAKRENSVIFMEKDYRTKYKGLENSAESDILFELIADKNRERSVELSRIMQQEVCKATGRVNGGAHQNNLAVLRLTSMPAALLELGFITTPDEENYLNTDTALDAYTRGMLNAFLKYKRKYGSSDIDVPYRDDADSQPQVQADDDVLSAVEVRQQLSQQTDTPVRQRTSAQQQRQPQPRTRTQRNTQSQQRDTQPQDDNAQPRQRETRTQQRQTQTTVNQSRPVFKVQIFSSKVKVKSGDTQFKGLKGCESYEEGSYIKYTYGASNNYNEIYRLRKEVAEKFPQAFIVAFKNGKKIDVNEGIKEFLANKKK